MRGPAHLPGRLRARRPRASSRDHRRELSALLLPRAIRDYLYQDHPNAALDWAFAFGKEVILIGDAMLRGGQRLADCYVRATYRLAAADARIGGLIWFIYDADLVDGTLSGAANDAALLALIHSLSVY